jgi:thiol-disulfide isomerase/thioredoxin
MRALPIASLLLLPALFACGSPPAEEANQTDPAANAAAPAGDAESGALDRSQAGSAAPGTSFQDPDGETVTLADFRGKPLLVNLWATWCAPCITEMPMLDKLAASEKDKVQVLTVSQDLEGKDKVDAFFAKNRFSTIEPYLDPEAGLSTDLKVQTLPTTILYDAQGREVWRMVGLEDWHGARAAALIQEASKG